MSSSEVYLAIKGKSREVILDELSLEKTDLLDDFQGGYFSDSWYLIVDPTWHFKTKAPNKIIELSRNCEVVYGNLDERVNSCTCGSLVDGQRIWQVEHNACDYELDHLAVEGTPPEIFQDIRDREIKKKEENPHKNCDFYFSIPVELFGAIVGYRYNRFPMPWKTNEYLRLKS